MMADEPKDLTLEIMRGIRSDIQDVRHSVDAVERKKKLEAQVVDLAARVEKLEKAK